MFHLIRYKQVDLLLVLRVKSVWVKCVRVIKVLR